MIRALACLVFFHGLAGWVLAAETAEVEIGGVRKVVATIGLAEGKYEIHVRMRPVRCFDPATNARLNREKAQHFAYQSLISFLGEENSRDASARISGATYGTPTSDGGFYCLEVRIPKDGVRILAQGRPVKEKIRDDDSERTIVEVVKPSALLTRKDDYRSTIEQLAELRKSELNSVVSEKALPKNDFYGKIAEIEERGMHNLDRLKSEIEGDKLLLRMEAQESLELVQGERDALIETLRQAVEKYDARPKK